MNCRANFCLVRQCLDSMPRLRNLAENHEGMIYVVMIRLFLRRLCNNRRTRLQREFSDSLYEPSLKLKNLLNSSDTVAKSTSALYFCSLELP